MNSVCVSYNLVSFLESQLFSNIISSAVAIGTIGAVIVALYLGLRKKKPKYIFSWDYSYIFLPYSIYPLDGVQFELLNKTQDCEIVLKSAPFLWNRKGNTKSILAYNPMPGAEGKLPRKLDYGDSYKFLIHKKEMKKLLKGNNDKVLEFRINDAFGKSYKAKIKRKIIEEWITKEG